MRHEQMPHPSLWTLTAADEGPRVRPSLAGTFDVAVVGAGITGLSTAQRLASEGARVVVLERRSIAAGTTGNSTAKLTALHGLIYADLRRRIGDERAGQYANANQRAVEDVARIVEEAGIDCNFTRIPALTYTIDHEHTASIEREVDAASALGLPAKLTEHTSLPFSVAAAVRLDDQAILHPIRYCHGLARLIEASGGSVIEHAPVRDLRAGRPTILETERGTVRADQVVLATLLPFVNAGLYFGRTEPIRSYALAACVAPEHRVEEACLGVGRVTRSVRPHRGDGEELLVLGGEGHPTGAVRATGACYGALEAWARTAFDVQHVVASWSAQDYVSVDRVPFVGRVPRLPGVWVATGFGKWGISNGTVAARLLADGLAGRSTSWGAVFDSTRSAYRIGFVHMMRANLEVAKHFFGDFLRRREAPRCTHLGCTLVANRAESTWDCPCRGSRFDRAGNILEGPATRPLVGPPDPSGTPGA